MAFYSWSPKRSDSLFALLVTWSIETTYQKFYPYTLGRSLPTYSYTANLFQNRHIGLLLLYANSSALALSSPFPISPDLDPVGNHNVHQGHS